jgi:hypothetical protein
MARHHPFPKGAQSVFNHFRQMLFRLQFRLEVARRRIQGVIKVLWRALRCRHDCVAVEVLLADRARRRAMKRQLRAALRRLRRALDDSFPSGTSVIVQRIVVTDRQLAGCYQLGQRADGTRFTLIRLALEIDGLTLSTDEILSVLAEQCIALAMQQSAASLLVPLDLYPVSSGPVRHPTPLRPDPLAAHAHGFDARGA